MELQQYPGFDPVVPTPLPHSLETTSVLDRVVQAQYDLKRKVRSLAFIPCALLG